MSEQDNILTTPTKVKVTLEAWEVHWALSEWLENEYRPLVGDMSEQSDLIIKVIKNNHEIDITDLELAIYGEVSIETKSNEREAADEEERESA